MLFKWDPMCLLLHNKLFKVHALQKPCLCQSTQTLKASDVRRRRVFFFLKAEEDELVNVMITVSTYETSNPQTVVSCFHHFQI